MSQFPQLTYRFTRLEGSRYAVTPSFQDAGSTVTVDLTRSGERLEFEFDQGDWLESLPFDVSSKRLSQAFFRSSGVTEAIVTARIVAEKATLPLRIRFETDASYRVVQTLPWEVLTDPHSGAPLGLDGNIHLSRLAHSRSMRPPTLPHRQAVTAYVAVAQPGNTETFNLEPFNVAEETHRITSWLSGVRPVGEHNAAPTGAMVLDGIIRDLNTTQADWFYLLAHGHPGSGQNYFLLANPDGKTTPVSEQDLVSRLSELPYRPSLVILAYPDSASTALSLVESGIPAALGFQGLISMDTYAQFMPAFLDETLRSGRVDAAATAGRLAARGSPDWWMPVVFSSLESAQIFASEQIPQPEEVQPVFVYTQVAALALHAEPHPFAETRATLPSGERLQVIDPNPQTALDRLGNPAEWIQVRREDGTVGFIEADQLALDPPPYPQAWIVVANPKTYPWEENFIRAASQPTPVSVDWTRARGSLAQRYIHETRPGDLVLAYTSSSSKRAIIGLGEISAPPFQRDGFPAVNIRLLQALSGEITLSELRAALPGLEKVRVERASFSSVASDLWPALRQLLVQKNPSVELLLPVAIAEPAPPVELVLVPSGFPSSLELGSAFTGSLRLRNPGNRPVDLNLYPGLKLAAEWYLFGEEPDQEPAYVEEQPWSLSGALAAGGVQEPPAPGFTTPPQMGNYEVVFTLGDAAGKLSADSTALEVAVLAMDADLKRRINNLRQSLRRGKPAPPQSVQEQVDGAIQQARQAITVSDLDLAHQFVTEAEQEWKTWRQESLARQELAERLLNLENFAVKLPEALRPAFLSRLDATRQSAVALEPLASLESQVKELDGLLADLLAASATLDLAVNELKTKGLDGEAAGVTDAYTKSLLKLIAEPYTPASFKRFQAELQAAVDKASQAPRPAVSGATPGESGQAPGGEATDTAPVLNQGDQALSGETGPVPGVFEDELPQDGGSVAGGAGTGPASTGAATPSVAAPVVNIYHQPVYQLFAPPEPPAPGERLKIEIGSDEIRLFYQDEEFRSPVTRLQNDPALARPFDFTPVQYGRRLFDAIITPDTVDAQHGSTAEGYTLARPDKRRQAIALKVSPLSPYAAYLWEYLADRRETPLAVYETSPFYRLWGDAPTAAQLAAWRIKQRPLKILFAICSPRELRPLDALTAGDGGLGATVDPGDIRAAIAALPALDRQLEVNLIAEAMADLVNAGLAQYTVLGSPEDEKAGRWVTWQRLSELAVKQGVHVLHILAHGVINPRKRSNPFALVMEAKDGAYDLVYNSAFTPNWVASSQLRLVVAASCNSGSPALRQTLQQDLASHLLSIGLPAVIAMQARIDERAAQILTRRFYDDLARLGHIEMALAAARTALYKDNPLNRSWGFPLLIMRQGMGELIAGDPAALRNLARPSDAEIIHDIKPRQELSAHHLPVEDLADQLFQGALRDLGMYAQPELTRSAGAGFAAQLAGRAPLSLPLAKKQDLAALAGSLPTPVELHSWELQAYVEKFAGLELRPAVYAQVVAGLNAGKHLILIGAHGTAKTTLARAICQFASGWRGAAPGGGNQPGRLSTGPAYANHYVLTTATADWTTFDTIGGFMPDENESLQFRPGLFLEAIRQGQWLIVDEINRAEIDKAIGPLFTVLSGQEVTLPYKVSGKDVRILPANLLPASKLAGPRWWIPDGAGQDRFDYVIHPNWRIIGTMNVYDKSSLFQLSFAFMRRFAFVDVDLPDDAHYLGLLDGWLEELIVAPTQAASQKAGLPFQAPDLKPLQGCLARLVWLERNPDQPASQAPLVAQNPLMTRRAIGPAILQDMLTYIGQRCLDELLGAAPVAAPTALTTAAAPAAGAAPAATPTGTAQTIETVPTVPAAPPGGAVEEAAPPGSTPVSLPPDPLAGYFAEAFSIYIVPQLDGLDFEGILAIYHHLEHTLFAGSPLKDDILRRVRLLYPHIHNWEKPASTA
jgi:MoxR-like ATPase